LNPAHVNAFRDFRTAKRGLRLWGGRTLSSDPEWKYINVRRLFLFLEQSIERGMQFAVFEPNNETLWATVKQSIGNFLIGVWRDGGLEGVTEEEAFFVRVGYNVTMSQTDIDNGRLIVELGVAPVKPAEFVIIRISQKTREAVA
jgi:phage tail sheath protein FI